MTPMADDTTRRSIGGSQWAALLVLCLGFFMVLLDQTIVNVAIPSIVDGLGAQLDQVLWVLSAYTLTYATLLILASRLGNVFGQRNLYAAGLVVFALGSAACGLARSPDALIAARVLQAAGGALLTPQILALLTEIFPAERRGGAFGVYAAVATVAPIAGPLLGGLIVTQAGWPWIFAINVPIAAVALALTFVAVPDIRPGRSHSLEPAGVLLSGGALFCVTFGLIEGPRYGWGTVTGLFSIPLVIGLGVALLAGFLAWDHFRAEPLVPLPLFRDRNFVIVNWIGVAVTFGMLGTTLLLTIYLQSVQGLTAIQAGLALAPSAAVSLPIGLVAGRLVDRVGGRYVLFAGVGLFAVGLGLVANATVAGAGAWAFLPGLLVSGFGLGMVYAPQSVVAMRDVPPSLAGAASGVLNTTRQVGSALGAAVVGALLQVRLTAALREEAVRVSGRLPDQARARFVAALARAGAAGLDVGPRHVAAPAGGGLQAGAAALAHQVFALAFADAMRTTLFVVAAVVAVGALSCLAIAQAHGAPAAAGRPTVVPSRALSPGELMPRGAEDLS
jgi:EmrB/QacA subfamily drug resistance transporter